MNYPEELVERAKFELRTFDRVGAETGELLLLEVMAWRAKFADYAYQPSTNVIVFKGIVDNE